MKIVFVSVILNIHQAAVSDELYRLTDGNFWFVETGDSEGENSKGGATDAFDDKPYLVRVRRGSTTYELAMKLVRDADVMVYGASPLVYLKERIKTGKLVFLYSERWLKRGLLNLFSPRLLQQQWFYHMYCRKKPFYALCASAYAASDFARMFSFKGKCYKWGYFTESSQLDISTVIKKRTDDIIKILWVGRLIDWKHPECMIDLARKLKNKKVAFCIHMIGAGEMYNQLQSMIVQYDLKDCLHLLGSMPNTQVKEFMQVHHIACFTSDKNEGWGAVLNEAMDCGCCPISSIETGSTPYLIQDGVNGFSFDLKKENDLFEKVLWLIEHPIERNKMCEGAYRTIHDIWSPQYAALQLFHLSSSILDGSECTITEGPCSMA
jgi:glycosyltransferase involved in cell wall biosynthesis